MSVFNNKVTSLIAASILMLQTSMASAFVVKHIRIEGIERIREDTVRNYITVKPGQDFKKSDSGELIERLYQTGFFDDVRLFRDDDDLVVRVEERPVIGSLVIFGNKVVKTDDLKKSLKDNGVALSQVYDRSAVLAIRNALEDQYHRLGRYNAKVEVKTIRKSRARVALEINIDEGKVARVRSIHIVGNQSFSERKLLGQFKLSRHRPWSILMRNDQFARDKLNVDLDHLRSFYMDRGYLEFQILSTQVELTPDKRDVYVTVNVHEGDIFTLTDYELRGDLKHKRKEILSLINLERNKPFNRKQVLAVNKRVNDFFADLGYSHVVVSIRPDVDHHKRTVVLVFEIKPGKPVYVRRVFFTGNTRTQDEVMRRELRQFESALYSQRKVEESKRRLANLGFLEHVDYRVLPVPHQEDLVDVNYNVAEASTATAQAQVGYSDSVGVLYGASLKQPNFLGTGRSVTIAFEKNDAYRNINLSYFNPYYTISGVGRGFNIYSMHTTPGRVGIGKYTTDSYGGVMHFSIPLSDYDHMTAGLGYRNMLIRTNSSGVSKEIASFLATNHDEYDQVNFTTGWSHTTLDRAIFPTHGLKSMINLDVGLPVFQSSLCYYKASVLASYYHQIFTRDWVWHARAKVAYGDGYGRTNSLPFFLNYYAGGMDTVRGVRDNSLGPRDSNGRPFGGNVLTTASASLIFPNPISDHLRTSVFLDAGTVFDNQFDLSELQYTGGLQMDWISPFGPLQFSLAYPLNHIIGQEKKVFQFSIGTSL